MLPVLAIGACILHYGLKLVRKHFNFPLENFQLFNLSLDDGIESYTAPDIMKVWLRFSIISILCFEVFEIVRLYSFIAGLWLWFH